MYTAILLILLAIAIFTFINGLQKKKKGSVILGVVIAAFTLAFFGFMDFWGEYLWFDNLGYDGRFWTEILSKVGFAAAGLIIGYLIVNVLTLSIPKNRKLLKYIPRLFGAFIGLTWGLSNWLMVLIFFNKVSTQLFDPILGVSTGFYMFSLPFFDKLISLILMLSIISFATIFISIYIKVTEAGINFYIPFETEIIQNRNYNALYLNAGFLLIILALWKYVSQFHLMYSQAGVVSGPGWTDTNILLPAYNIVTIITFVLALFLIVPFLRKRLHKILGRFRVFYQTPHLSLLISSSIFIIIIWFLALSVIPGSFQFLVVQPNEITYEKPYIANNIKFTQFGFGLNKIQEKQYPFSGPFNQATADSNKNLFSNVRLWDWRALDAVYRQFQEFRLYYQFSDVDVDRYNFDDQYRQVMISGREMNITNLPDKSKTFVNERFQYTHGYGITMATVNEFTEQGLPHLLVKDIPPVSEYPSLDVKTPQIYYGEETNSYVVVNTKEKEFDYPSGEKNVYTKYAGSGGVQIKNLWRKFLFGWKLDGTQFFFSDYPTDSSRIMFHRQIRERVSKLAPFLHFDKDAYIVLADGKLYWILDAYTTSDYFPYSEHFNSLEKIEYQEGNAKRVITSRVGNNLDGINYIRNSVKAVVDAYTGEVNFYIFDQNDPLIQVWNKIFPNLFKPENQMPKDLLAHIRYPVDMLLVQGLVYEKYHMTDPNVFYNQEDLWVRATEKYYNHVQPVEPYYIMWQLPGSDKQQFVLILPFTPKNRQVLIGWVAVMCDPSDYGKFLAYQFPKDKTVLGPQQVETKIDQDRFLSGQLTLWDQRGSNVIRGNVLAIPINKTLFYVEPIYLQAETAAYPELRLVVVMHGDDLSYGESFSKALSKLFNQTTAVETAASEETQTVREKSTLDQDIKTANNAFENYLKFQSQKKFDAAAKEMEKLQDALNRLSKKSGNSK